MPRRDKLEEVRRVIPDNTVRAAGLASEKGASSWLTMILVKKMSFTLNKREFRDGIRPRYDWRIADTCSNCVCDDTLIVDLAMVCIHRGFIFRGHNELRDLEADMLSIVYLDVQVEHAPQEITGKMLARETNGAPDARLDVHAPGF